MAAMTRPGRVMGPLKAGGAGTMAAALGAVVGSGNVGGAAVGMAADVGMLVGGIGASPPHAEIPARSAARAKAEIDRGHRTISKF